MLWFHSLKQRGQRRAGREVRDTAGAEVVIKPDSFVLATFLLFVFSLLLTSKQSGLKDACRDFASCHQLFFTLGEHTLVPVRKTWTYGRIWRGKDTELSVQLAGQLPATNRQPETHRGATGDEDMLLRGKYHPKQSANRNCL